MLERVNKIRAEAGIPTLKVDLRLVAAARARVEDMAQGGPTGHEGSDGSMPEDRVRSAGYAYLTLGENVAAGQATAADVVDRWMSSEHHRENILDAAFRHIGIAYAGVRWSRYGTYWVQVFGAPLHPEEAPRTAACNPPA